MGRGSLMNNKYKSVFRDEIGTYMTQRQAELGSISYRHNKAVVLLFDNYLFKIGHQEKSVPMKLMDEWIRAISSGRQPNTVVQYVHYIRQLMKYLISCGYRCIIPQNLVTRDSYSPYIYSDVELIRIFQVADSFKAPKAVKNRWIETEIPMLLRLLYCCGLRLGEAVHLKLKDIDFSRGIITLKVTKKYKQRLVPMHDELTAILRDYCIAMGIIVKPDAYLFPGIDKNTPLAGNNIRNYYKKLLLLAGITRGGYQPYERGACIHCFRHVFAINAFKNAGIKITDAVPFLSTYLGHDSLYETEKYLKFSGDLFPDTIEKFEVYTDGIFPEVIINE
jgi:integrase